MAPWPSSPRIIAMDLNSRYGSPTFQEMAKDYESDGSAAFTASSLPRILGFSFMTKRIDTIWYDTDAGSKKTGGFLSPSTRSEHFGSDHRAVWSRVRI